MERFFISKAKVFICAILSLEQGVIATSPTAEGSCPANYKTEAPI